MADNSTKKNGNAYICDKIPKIFQGLDINEVIKTLSAFSCAKKETLLLSFKTDGKEITAKCIGGGLYGDVYKLSDSYGNCAALKIFNKEVCALDTFGGISEIAASRQLSKDNVIDVPEFYMSDAGLYRFDNNGKTLKNNAWMLTEYIDDDKIPPKNGLNLNKWLQIHSMKHYDNSIQNKSNGGYTLDIGGIASLDKKRDIWGIFGFGGEYSDCALGVLLENSLKSGMSVSEIIKVFK